MRSIQKEYFNTEEASAYISMSRAWLEAGRYRGSGPPYIKLGHAVRYRRSALDEYMAAREREHTAEG